MTPTKFEKYTINGGIVLFFVFGILGMYDLARIAGIVAIVGFVFSIGRNSRQDEIERSNRKDDDDRYL